MNIKIEVSARHCHISQKDLDKLFGPGYNLQPIKDLSQIGQFASKEKIILKTGHGQLDLRILGPVRDQTQIELSRSDAYRIKIKPPVRLSGDLKGSPGGVIIGPKGQVKLKEGIIIAKRHLHCDPKSAKKLKLRNNQKVKAEVAGERGVIFKEVMVRIKPDYTLSIHIDTDEGNASTPEGICTSGRLII